MGLFESIEKIIINNDGKVNKEELFELLKDKYAKETIWNFLEQNSNIFTVSNESIDLKDYKINGFLNYLSDFIKREHVIDPQYFKYIANLFLKVSKNERIDSNRPEPFFGLSKDEHIQRGLIDAFQRIQFEDWNDTKFVFKLSSKLFDFLLSNVLRDRTLFSTPDTLIDLILNFIPQKEHLKIYNPTAGILKLLTAVKVFSDSKIDAYTSEINNEIYEYGVLFAQSNKFHGHFRNEDSLRDSWRSIKYDLVLCNPPFSLKTDRFSWDEQKYKDVSLNIISNSLSYLNENGVGIFLIPDSVLFGFSNELKSFRRDIIDYQSLKTIISLPVKLFAPISSLKTSLLIFDKNFLNQKVQFLDISNPKYYSLKKDKTLELDIKKILSRINPMVEGENKDHLSKEALAQFQDSEFIDIPYSEIRKNDYSLQINSYKVSSFQKEGIDYVALNEILKVKRLRNAGGLDLPYIRISEMNGGVIDNPRSLGFNTTSGQGKLLDLDSPAILIGNVGGSHKPTYFDGSFIVEVSTNVTIFDFKEDLIFIPYIIQELNADYVKMQMETMSVGSTTLKHLRQKDLLQVQIKLPKIEEQKKIYAARKEFISEQSFIPKDKIQTISDDNVFGTIKHEIGNILRGPGGFMDLLPDFLKENQISLDQPIVKANGAESIGQMIEISQRNIKQVYTVLENMKGILFSEQRYFRPQRLELRSYFRNRLNKEIINGNTECHIGVNGVFNKPINIYAEFDPDQFDYILRNIFTNACKHGKLEENLKFIINIESLEDIIEIHFINNGTPFASDFGIDEYIKFGNKHGDSDGSGLGGYLIHQVVKNHHGTLEILPGGQAIEISNSIHFEKVDANVDILITIPKKQ